MLNDWMQQGDYFSFQKNNQSYQIFYCDSADLEAASASQKPVLVLIHGFPTASIDWQHLWPDLTRYFRVICLDMLGFGLSDKPQDFTYSIAQQADVFQSLLASLNIHHYHLFAHDYGDTVAQEMIARESSGDEKIASCILLNGGLFPETHHPVLLQKVLISPLGRLLIHFYSFKKLCKTFDRICQKKIPQHELKVYWNLLELNNGLRVMPKLIRYMQERKVFRQRWVGSLQTTSIPLRLIDGIEDPISGAHMIARYRQLIANADVVELKETGHYPQLESPDQVLKAALDFWQQHEII